MNSKVLWIASTFVCSLALGCGGDDGGGTGGVSGSKQLSTLTPSEAKSLCNAVQAKLTRAGAATQKLECTATAYAASGGNASSCNSARTQCLNSGTNDNTDFDLDCANSATSIQDCDATVDQLTKCADALASSTEAAANKLTCSSSTSDFAQFSASFTSPSECDAVNACPGFGDSSSDDTTDN